MCFAQFYLPIIQSVQLAIVISHSICLMSSISARVVVISSISIFPLVTDLKLPQARHYAVANNCSH